VELPWDDSSLSLIECFRLESTARNQLPPIVPCILIDVRATFRVDWHVFPLLRQWEGHRAVVHAVVAIVVAAVRAVLKIMGHG
jgi:hypothetical protein